MANWTRGIREVPLKKIGFPLKLSPSQYRPASTVKGRISQVRMRGVETESWLILGQWRTILPFTLATETGNLVVELRLGLKPDHLSRISPRLMPPRADYGRIYDGLNSDGSLIGKNS